MADVFLSYAHADKDRAAKIAAMLDQLGYDVFWDVEIPPGTTWADFLEEKLGVCKAAIVLWTKNSTSSQAVREEARLARDRAKLIPVLLDQVSLPFGFGEIQAANLSTWRGEPDHPQWKLVLAALERAMGQAPKPTPRPAPAAAQPGWNTAHAAPADADKPKPKWLLWGGVALAAFVLLGVAGAIIDEFSAPSSAVPAIHNPANSYVAIAPAVEQVLQQARAAQAAARAAADQGAQAAQAGNAAAIQAQQGLAGFGQTQLNPTTQVAGDLAAFQQGRPGAVIMRNTQLGTTFTGLIELDPATGLIRAMTGAVDNGRGGAGLGRTVMQGQNMQSSGRDSTPVYTAEGTGQGLSGSFESTAIGVITFADGRRYEGQYVSRGRDANVFRNGLGATYGVDGAMIEAGRYESDKLVGPS